MISLFRKHDTARHAWRIVKWHECRESDSVLNFYDRVSAALWLRRFASDDLRRIANEYDDGSSVSRMSDHGIAERVAGLIVSGYLRVCHADTENDAGSNKSEPRHSLGAEHKLIRRLRVTAKEFTFEMQRFRIISAEDWFTLREKTGGRYQIVPREDAQQLLDKMSDWPAISSDEKKAIQEVVSLVPDTRRVQIPNGILLVQIVARSSARDTSHGEPASTPSQLAGREQKDKLHWVQIELVDAVDQPVPNEPYRLELPDGSIREGNLDSKGRVYIGDIIVPGECRVCFPQIDAKEWRTA